MEKELILNRAKELGAKQAKMISVDSIVIEYWVRIRCQYGCESYGKRLSCPPFSPTPEETKKILKGYHTACLFQADILKCMELAVKLEREFFLKGYYKAFGLGDGPCFICGEKENSCSIKNGCKYPRQMRPSLEACGIDVFQTIRNNGWKIDVVKHKGDKTTDIGMLLIE